MTVRNTTDIQSRGRQLRLQSQNQKTKTERERERRRQKRQERWDAWIAALPTCVICEVKIDNGHSHRPFNGKGAPPVTVSSRSSTCSQSCLFRLHPRQKPISEGNVTKDVASLLWTAQDGKCHAPWCARPLKDPGKSDSGLVYHLDHYIPLAKGGTHTDSNLVLLCFKCNLSKHDTLPDEWARANGWEYMPLPPFREDTG